ncbi:hypothetical protein H6P81_013014 [Aristolochia fimbriata]|uniref:Uncharacterized protein n=1 Tax=Aristolochia fimbriata TaxID=158543 RepID=A0AAV7EEP1_ARIFI|nr:hypothetical protein H6P81_013014 [Aristolochia fimbriata]
MSDPPGESPFLYFAGAFVPIVIEDPSALKIVNDVWLHLGKLKEVGFDTSSPEQFMDGISLGAEGLHWLADSLRGKFCLEEKLAKEAKIMKSIRLATTRRDNWMAAFNSDLSERKLAEEKKKFNERLALVSAHLSSLDLKIAATKKNLDADDEEILALEWKLAEIVEKKLAGFCADLSRLKLMIADFKLLPP